MRLKKNIIFITGATGLLGTQLALQALKNGQAVRLLTRQKNNMSGSQRIQRVWKLLGEETLAEEKKSSIEILEGDTSLPLFGLSRDKYQAAIADVTDIFHCAGYVDFTDSSKERFRDANVQSTSAALTFAKDAGATMHHISTAYIARCDENSLIDDSEIRNAYEGSKRTAECLVHDTCKEQNIDYSIYRPSIMLASAANGASMNFYNFYLFLRALTNLKQESQTVHLHLSADHTLNLIPVDYAAEAIWKISRSPASIDHVFHICNTHGLSFHQLRNTLETLFDLRFEFVTEKERADFSRVEKLLNGIIDRFSDYARRDINFSLKHTKSILPDYEKNMPQMNTDYFQQLFSYAKQHHWGRHTWCPDKTQKQTQASNYPEQYYRFFLQSKINQLLVNNLKTLDAVFKIELRDNPASTRTITLKKGRLIDISQTGEIPECCYRTTSKTFQEITEGIRTPQDAFFDQDIDIEGDIEKGLRVATALAEFFKTYPFVAQEVTA